MKQDYDRIFNEVFSEYFIDKRKERGLSRKYVSDRLLLPESTFTFYEKGKRDVPISVFKKMCAILVLFKRLFALSNYQYIFAFRVKCCDLFCLILSYFVFFVFKLSLKQ